MNRSAKSLLMEAWKRRRAGDDDGCWSIVWTLQRVGDAEVYDVCADWCVVGDEDQRSLAANVLGQLGRDGLHMPFAEASVSALEQLLSDDAPDVVASAIYALAHLSAEAPVLKATNLASHAEPAVREAMASALGSIDHDNARSRLIQLSKDPDEEVRNWATFGLAQLQENNTKPIREALAERLSDFHEETRCEAILGLSLRHDARAIEAINAELTMDEPLELIYEAAEKIASPVLLDRLEQCAARLDDQSGKLQKAISACQTDN